MERLFRAFLTLIVAVGFAATVTSCGDKGIEPENPGEKQRLIFIYAVAANNLEYNLVADLREILEVAPSLNLKNNAVVVYSVDNTGECTLRELRKNEQGNFVFAEVNRWPELPLSTNEERIAEVMGYVAANYPYPRKGLILWSHADGWLPWFGGSSPSLFEDGRRSFGWDNFEGATYKTNIQDLANAIPDDTFDFIWFDCCYMANIETVYQLKDKADYIVGYVLEIASDGMPYQLTMPYLLQRVANLPGAASALFDYYNSRYTAVSVSIMDTDNLDMLVDASRDIFGAGGEPTGLSAIQTYQRDQPVKFYDMGQLLRSYSHLDNGMKSALTDAFDKVVIYKRISQYDFNHKEINVTDYSGLSMYNYTGADNRYEDFYRTLDWYNITR